MRVTNKESSVCERGQELEEGLTLVEKRSDSRKQGTMSLAWSQPEEALGRVQVKEALDKSCNVCATRVCCKIKAQGLPVSVGPQQEESAFRRLELSPCLTNRRRNRRQAKLCVKTFVHRMQPHWARPICNSFASRQTNPLIRHCCCSCVLLPTLHGWAQRAWIVSSHLARVESRKFRNIEQNNRGALHIPPGI